MGDGAGVGGEAGAEGSMFIGKDGRVAVDRRVGPVPVAVPVPVTEGRDLADLIESDCERG